MRESILVYGADWCEDTLHTLQHLNDLKIDYKYINIEKDPASTAWVKQQNGGKQKTPTVDIAGAILVEPENDELDAVLHKQGLLQM